MKNGGWSLLCFIVLPFAMGAVFQFAPMWIAIPAVIALAMFWLGVMVQICEAHK